MTPETETVMAEIMQEYKREPAFYVEHALGHCTWSKQREILNSIRDNERTAVRASHGVSKTFTAAEATTWFLNTFENSKVITTAPTFPQVKMLLWAEINSIYTASRIKLEGVCLSTEIKTDKGDHYAIGFSTDKPARAEGWHAPAILFIFDEAKGMPQWIWDSVRGLMTGGQCRWLAISTTDGVQVGENYHTIFNDLKSDWNRIHISAFDSPYVTGEKFHKIEMPDLSRPDRFTQVEIDPSTVRFQIASPKYIEQCEKDWGKDSVLFLTKVKGEIVDAGADTIIKLSQVMQMVANAALADFDAAGQEEAGVDVARGGTDDTVMFRRKGMKVVDGKVIASPQLPEKAKLYFIAEKVEQFVGYSKKVRIKIDDTGVGGGATDILQRKGYNVIPVNFGATANDQDKYPDTISEMWFEVGRVVQEIAHDASPRLQAELVNRKEKALDKKGRRVIESKKEYKGRGFRSPDEADAFLLTFYNPSGSATPKMWRVQ
jgi:hypothetical protein